MSWIPIALGAYLFSGLAAILDKILLKKGLPDPFVFAFWTGLLSLGILVLAPIEFQIISLNTTIIALFSGAASLAALYCFYVALRRSDASQIVPLITGTTPIFILLFEYFLLNHTLTQREFLAFTLFIGGGIILGVETKNSTKTRFNYHAIFWGTSASLFFAITFFLADVVFDRAPFISGFIWIRLGSVMAAILMLLLPGAWMRVLRRSERTAVRMYGIFLFTKIFGAMGLLMLSYAIAVGPVAIINAMQGLENLFVFLMALAISFSFPKLLRESFGIRSFVAKAFGTLLVGLGFIYLV